MSEYRYKAFISYSHSDERWARWLHRSLEHYRVPPHIVRERHLVSNRILPIFRDREEFATSADLSESIEKALSRSDNLIVICSRSSAKSQWVDEEIRYFRELGLGDRIYCFLVDDPEESIPRAWSEISAGRTSEPLAADARRNSDGKNLAKLKIIAALLDVGLDELRQRELRRQHRRLAYYLTGAVTGMTIMSGLAVYAYFSQLQAERETAISESSLSFLVDVFQISDPRSARGNTVTAREVLDEGVAKLEEEMKDQPLVRARLADTMGRVYRNLGLYDEAERLARLAVSDHELLLGPSAVELALSLHNLGWLMERRGRYDEAALYLERALDILESPIGRNDAETAAVLNDLGVVFKAMGDTKRAQELYERALKMREAVFGDEHNLVAQTLNNLATLAHTAGDLTTAQTYYQRSLAIKEKVLASGHPDLATTLNNLAVLAHDRQEFEEARKLLQRALTIQENAVGTEHPNVAIVLHSLANVNRDQGRYDEARRQYARVSTIYDQSLDSGHNLVIELRKDLVLFEEQIVK